MRTKQHLWRVRTLVASFLLKQEFAMHGECVRTQNETISFYGEVKLGASNDGTFMQDSGRSPGTSLVRKTEGTPSGSGHFHHFFGFPLPIAGECVRDARRESPVF